ncbi:MAG: hypothetical protein ABOK23_13680 [Candidatus Methanoperedens sp.]|nr:hypothetical protein [Candidatus Methanoperedens sp.]MCZ7396271.1 hypothetical protein [Candidatus Methanoperedens sp.]
MAIKSIGTLIGNLKELYDKSKEKSGWRVLHGMNRGYHDTFIAGDNNLWQIKSEEVKPGEFVAVGMKVSSCDDELTKIMKNGSPVPFGTVTPRDRKISIIMAGIQTYSSDSSSLLCREHLSSRQAELEQKLKQQVNRMMGDPAFRRKYIEHKDRLGRAYL